MRGLIRAIATNKFCVCSQRPILATREA